MARGSAVPEHVHRVEAFRDGEHLAVQLHVAAKRLPVDIVLKRVRDFGSGLAGDLLGEIGEGAVFACIIVEGSARLFKVVAEMAVEFRAKAAMFLNEIGKVVVCSPESGPSLELVPAPIEEFGDGPEETFARRDHCQAA